MPKTKSRYLLSKTKSREDEVDACPCIKKEIMNVLHTFVGHVMKMHGRWKLLTPFFVFNAWCLNFCRKITL
jgi:hypothetical protein